MSLVFLQLQAAWAGTIVINELHYNPDVKVEPAEFLELYNAGTNNVNLAGWSLGGAIQYTFPATNVAPGGYAVVAQNPAFLVTKFAATGALGPYTNTFSKYGEKVTLRNAAGGLEDEVNYQVGFPWPTVGDPPGLSIELINPALDNNLGGSWRASTNGGVRGPTPGRANTVRATNAPPQIRQVEHQPEQPRGGEVVKITARVTDPEGVASVVLQYQIVAPGNYIERTNAAFTNATNWVSVPMNDAGTNGDLTAGDDLYSADLPVSVQAHRRLIRYRITVADGLGAAVRVPYADDPQPNFAYFCYDGVPAWTGAAQPGGTGTNGVVITVPAAEMSRLPVYHLLAQSNSFATAIGWAPGQPNNKYTGDEYLWTGALVVDGKVYDHIGFRCRGGVWRYSMGKNAMKFTLNRGHDLEVKDNWGRKLNAPWRRLSLRANIQQGDYLHRGEQGLFESVGYRLFDLAGAFGLKHVQMQFRVIDDAREAAPGNQYLSDFYGLWLAVEEDDGRFLEERGLPDGNIYDMEGNSGTLNHTGGAGPTDKSDLNQLLTYGGATPTEAWWRTNLNLPSYYSYQTIVQGIHHYDIADGKNYFYYKNPVTRLWTVLPWDLDLTWADNMYRADSTRGDEPFRSRVLNNFASPGTFTNLSIEFRNRVREIRDLLFNPDEAFKLIDEYWWLTRGTNTYSIVDADRALWDYNPVMLDANVVNLSKAGNYHFYQWQNEPGTSNNFSGASQLMKNYVRYRGTNASLNGTATGLDGVALDNLKPARPAITYTGPTNYPINRLTFRSSNYSGSNAFGSMRWRVGEVTDPAAPPFVPGQPRKYEIETVWDSGPLPAFNPDITLPASALRVGSRYRARVLHTDITGRNSNWSPPVEFVCGESDNIGDLLNFLRVTEVMYNPPPAGYEFLELHNASPSVTLDLAGVKFTQGIDYTCLAGTTLPPGGYLLVIGTTNVAAFRAYYGLDESVTILAAFTGSLNNAGEQITLRTAAGGTDIVAFNYSDGRGWAPAADGGGHSLVLLDSAGSGQNAGSGEYGGNWRASTYQKGSPGRADAVPPAGIVLNEIVAHTDFTAEFDSNDWIELYNPAAADFTFGPGWYLSDDATNLTKWAVPPTNVIVARGWLTFDEVTGFHHPTNLGFGLNKGGEQVFLSYLPGTTEDRVVDAVTFKGQENDWSLGRYPDGGPFWFALNPRTRDTTNAAPPARVVLSEVLYHPPDIGGTNDNALDEFIELHNATDGPVEFFNTNGAWRLNGGVDFTFATNFTLGSGDYLLVVNFNPATNAAQLAAFKTLYGITNAGLVIVGPYAGKLANNSDRVALEKPQHPDGTNGLVDWVIVDEVIYADQSPWPCGSDGTGNSLQRLSAAAHGGDPANWVAEFPTAGRPRAMLPAGLAVIVNQPQSRAVPTNGSASFSVSVCGSPPFTYQWRFNGTNLNGATNATLNLFNVTFAHAGDYSVVISNTAGGVASQAATLVVQVPPFIAAGPQSISVARDQSASFSVTAGGTPPFQYQWRFNGLNLAGATNTSFLVTNAQAAQAGNYAVLVANSAGSALSANALLTVLLPPVITNQPASQTVTNGATVTLAVGAFGTAPLAYQWRFNDTNLPGATGPSLVMSNAVLEQSGVYAAVVSNAYGTSTSSNATLLVLTKPVITAQPMNQTVLQGGTAIFTVTAYGTQPMGYRWRRNFGTVTNFVNSLGTSTLIVTNVQMTTNYTVVLTNQALPTGGLLSSNAVVTVLADADRDGLADAWEITYGLSSTNALDAAIDSDGDGMTNLEEYTAGTDPTNNLSYLKIDSLQRLAGSNQLWRVEFAAVSNKTYTVFQRDGFVAAPWVPWVNVDAAPTNRVLQLTNQPPPGWPQRYFRLLTPRLP